MFRAINWWYVPVVLCQLAAMIVKLLACLLVLSMPLWLAAGIVGLI